LIFKKRKPENLTYNLKRKKFALASFIFSIAVICFFLYTISLFPILIKPHSNEDINVISSKIKIGSSLIIVFGMLGMVTSIISFYNRESKNFTKYIGLIISFVTCLIAAFLYLGSII